MTDKETGTMYENEIELGTDETPDPECPLCRTVAPVGVSSGTLTIDYLAHLIRYVDWGNKLAPEELAEKILAFMWVFGLSIHVAPRSSDEPNDEER